MEQIGLTSVVESVDKYCQEGNFPRAEELLYPALDQFPDVGTLWFYAAAIHMGHGHSVLAMWCWEKCYQLECNSEVLVNLGATARLTNQVELSRAILQRLLDFRPDDPKALANLCGSYVNEGTPWLGIPYGERCLALDPEAKQGQFNLGLLYLEAGEYARGFDNYAIGTHRLRSPKTYTPDPPYLTPELFDRLKAGGRTPKLLITEEQGIGDSIMFATVYEDAAKDFDLIIDAHPRLESIYRRSRFADKVTIHGTRKIEAPEWSHQADAKCLAGDLGRFYRRDAAAFKWRGPLFKPDASEVSALRGHLESLAEGRPIIGLAIRGGTPSTNRRYRGIKLDVLEPLLALDALFVSLDYEDVTEEVTALLNAGKRVFWSPAINWHFDYLHTAALVAATDRVVTVCQSVAHLSAAMGHHVDVLVPSKPAWRYGLTGETWRWYPHSNARLLRQEGNDWAPAARRLNETQETGLKEAM